MTEYEDPYETLLRALKEAPEKYGISYEDTIEEIIKEGSMGTKYAAGSGVAPQVRQQDKAARMTYALMDILLDMVGGVLVLTAKEWEDAMENSPSKQIDFTENPETGVITFRRENAS